MQLSGGRRGRRLGRGQRSWEMTPGQTHLVTFSSFLLLLLLSFSRVGRRNEPKGSRVSSRAPISLTRTRGTPGIATVKIKIAHMQNFLTGLHLFVRLLLMQGRFVFSQGIKQDRDLGGSHV